MSARVRKIQKTVTMEKVARVCDCCGTCHEREEELAEGHMSLVPNPTGWLQIRIQTFGAGPVFPGLCDEYMDFCPTCAPTARGLIRSLKTT